MDSSNKDKIEGHAKEAKGAVKETIGRVTNDADTEASGATDKAEGKAQNKVGDVKKVFGK
ncbi:MAG: CsbD family protein [Verrucomicrobiota bacterium]|nr:CsbD family protein [Verrucomicrobiota bacterium]